MTNREALREWTDERLSVAEEWNKRPSDESAN